MRREREREEGVREEKGGARGGKRGSAKREKGRVRERKSCPIYTLCRKKGEGGRWKGEREEQEDKGEENVEGEREGKGVIRKNKLL